MPPYTLLKHQVKPTDELLNFLLSSEGGCLLIGATGVGKTYVLANAIRRAQEAGKYLTNDPSKPMKMYGVMLLTPKKAIIQQRRVFFREGVKDFEVVNHNALVSSYGELFINWVSEYVNGKLQLNPVWDNDLTPDVIFVDECQFVKNFGSARTQVILAAIKAGIKIVLISATPCQKAIEAEVIAMACGLSTSHKDFDNYAWTIAPNGPEKNSPLAMKRLKQDLINAGKLINITGARYPFKPIIRNIYLPLAGEKRVIYDKTWEEYLAVVAREGRRGPQGFMAICVAKNKYRETSELLKVEDIATRAFQVATFAEQPRQVIIAACFTATLEKVWSCLVKQHGVNKEEISTLWGGQSDTVAQENIDKFQDGRARYFLATMKSGGTSISLHHEEQYPNALPRYVILGLSWSVYEMVQILGRAQRITSASQTIQEIVAYKGTVEEEVGIRLEEKFDCLRELIERKDSFIHDVFNSRVKDLIDQETYDKLAGDAEGETEDDDKEETEKESDLGFLGEKKEFGETE